MALKIALVLFLGIAARLGSAVPLEGRQASGFKFLGKAKNPVIGLQSRAGTFQESYYFISQNAAAWTNANSDCKAFLGGSLINIETEEELRRLEELLANDDTIAKVWLGGAFDSSRNDFVWGTGVEFGAWSPWAPGHPNTKTPVTKVAANLVGGIQFETHFQTVSKRYICELSV